MSTLIAMNISHLRECVNTWDQVINASYFDYGSEGWGFESLSARQSHPFPNLTSTNSRTSPAERAYSSVRTYVIEAQWVRQGGRQCLGVRLDTLEDRECPRMHPGRFGARRLPHRGCRRQSGGRHQVRQPS